MEGGNRERGRDGGGNRGRGRDGGGNRGRGRDGGGGTGRGGEMEGGNRGRGRDGGEGQGGGGVVMTVMEVGGEADLAEQLNGECQGAQGTSLWPSETRDLELPERAGQEPAEV